VPHRPRECEDVDAADAGAAQDARAFADGGAGGEDVVDEEDALAAHVAVDFVVPRFAPPVRRALYALGLAALAGLFVWALPGVVDYLRFMLRERTPVLDLPFGAVYCVFAAATVMVVLRCAAGILRELVRPRA